MTSQRAAERGQKASAGLVVLVAALLGAEWILCVAGVKLHEMVVGAVATALSLVFLVLVYRSAGQHLQLRGRDLAQAWRIPWYLLSDAWVITRVLLSPQEPGSFYRVSGFRTAKRDPELVARRVLATLYTTVSPNSIVIGVDWEQSRLLMHQLERSPVAKMTRNLGGQP